MINWNTQGEKRPRTKDDSYISGLRNWVNGGDMYRIREHYRRKGLREEDEDFFLCHVKFNMPFRYSRIDVE